MDITNLNVTVIGGAIGGCAAALLLARAGANVTLLEKVATPRAIGAGIGLADNGSAVLASLGLEPALDRIGRPVIGARITDAKGRVLFTPPTPAPRVLMLRRAALQSLLLDALAASNVRTHFGAEVLAASRDGSVLFETAAGRGELLSDLVIGADGLHSIVRRSGDFGAKLSRPGIPYFRMLLSDVAPEGVEAWTSAGLFGSFPVDTGAYVFASAGSRATRRAVARRDLVALAAAWAKAYPPSARFFAAITSWDQLILNRVMRVDCKRWHDGRLALLGDAAHAMAPNLGQGANSALVDAAVLLAELHTAPDLATALTRYTARRRQAVRKVADVAGRLGTLAELTNPIARLVRDRVIMPLAQRTASPATQTFVMQEPLALLRHGPHPRSRRPLDAVASCA